MKIILYLILSHLIADFVLQNDNLVAKKKAYYSKYHKVLSFNNPLLIHGVFVFCIMQILHLFYDSSLVILVMTLLITIGHLVIDNMKLTISKKLSSHEIFSFIIDQVAHVLLIYMVSSWFELSYESKFIPVMGSYSTLDNNGKWWIPEIENSYLFTLMILILFSYVAGYIISFMLVNLKIVKNDQERSKNGLSKLHVRHLSELEKKTGIKIGIIERLLVIIFVAAGQYGAMGLILAGKSLARYEELKDKDFSEYYLYGTLLSFLFGITGGLIINKILS